MPIPTCQRALPVYAPGQEPRLVAGPDGEPLMLNPPPTGHRLCGQVSTAVHRFPDGVELFTCAPCDGELSAQADPGPEWRLHNRNGTLLCG